MVLNTRLIQRLGSGTISSGARMKSFARETKTVLPMQASKVFPNPHRLAMMVVALEAFLGTFTGTVYSGYD